MTSEKMMKAARLIGYLILHAKKTMTDVTIINDPEESEDPLEIWLNCGDFYEDRGAIWLGIIAPDGQGDCWHLKIQDDDEDTLYTKTFPTQYLENPEKIAKAIISKVTDFLNGDAAVAPDEELICLSCGVGLSDEEYEARIGDKCVFCNEEAVGA